MEGFDLDALQAELCAVQAEETTYRLSERNCVDILQRLKKTGQIKVIYTQDGKQYLTPERIRSEVMGEIEEQGGRTTLTDIQAVMNIDITFVQEKAEAIVAEDKT